MTRPLISLACNNCGARIIRVWATGLLIGDGTATVRENSEEQCHVCQHVHVAGDVLRFYLQDNNA